MYIYSIKRPNRSCLQTMTKTQPTDRSYALELDKSDLLARYRKRFYIPEGAIYMDGNSLGLLSADAEASLHRVLSEWRQFGIRGWLEAQKPWFWFAEELGEMAAPLVGAAKQELVLTGTTTVNIHSLISTFYTPSQGRTKILADALNFPSDIYALKGQISIRGLDPDKELVLAGGNNQRLLDEDQLVSMMTKDVALVFLPSVLFTSGQLLDMKYLTEEAHKRGICIGFDCSHSAGAIPHHFHEWDIDFATFCGYKYLNGGPGCPAFLYVNKKHFDRKPMMAGWFGYNKEKQFEMLLTFEHAIGAGGWQISSPGIFGAATLEGSLRLFGKTGIEAIRKKSLNLTSYFITLISSLFPGTDTPFTIITPIEPHRRGGHVALAHPTEAWRITQALKARGIIPDFRTPDVIRIAPAALYNTFEEVWQTAHILKRIIDKKEYKKFPKERTAIS